VAKWVAVALAAVVLGTLTACNTDQLPPPGQFTNVSGQITDRATQQPVAGAVITIDTVLTATTDASGKFAIAKVPAGTIDFTVTADGYALTSSTVNAAPGGTFTLNVALDRSPHAP
jgi:hypothetical protein